MSNQPLFTSTAEICQPVRLLYEVADSKRLVAVFKKLKCMDYDQQGNRWVWIYDDEARSLKFKRSWKEVSLHAPIVIGAFHQPEGKLAEFVVRSIERATMAITFMDEHVSRSVARVTHLDVLNRLLRPDEVDVKPEAFFAGMETALEKQANDLAELQTNPLKLMSFTMRQMRGEQRETQPEAERMPCVFYEDGLSHVESMLRMRQHLALRHWNGEAELTMMDMITEGVAKMTGTSPQAIAKPMPQRTRIDWDFDPEIPTRDFFDCLDLTEQYDVAEALENFLRKVKRDEFRLWEAIIRDEQNLPTVPVLVHRQSELFSFEEPEADEAILSIDGLERLDTPWYEVLRQIAAHLVVDPMQTSKPCFDNEMIHWHILTLELQRCARGLSLPEGVQRAIDVVPAEVRHQLGLQYCFDGLMDLGSYQDVTLDHEDEWWRIDDFQNRLWEHRESVEFFDLTFDGLLERCIMPEKDQRILFDSFRQRLGLQSADQPLAPRLRKVQPVWTTAPLEPICEDVIRNAILHPERIVHRTAMWYFAASKSRDPAVASLVLDALDALNNPDDRKFAAACLKRLLISDAAAERILKLLQSHGITENDSEEHDRYADSLGSALLSASPAFLVGKKEPIHDVISRLSLGSLVSVTGQHSDEDVDPDERWNQFSDYVEASLVFSSRAHGYPSHCMVDQMERLARSLGDDPRLVEWIKETLCRTLNDANYSLIQELIAVRLAGVLHLPWAVPFLVALLHDDEPRMVREAIDSLITINDDTIPETLDRWFRRGQQHYQFAAIDVLERVRSPAGNRVLQQWLTSDSDEDEDEGEVSCNDESIECRIRQALLAQFLTSELEPVRAWYLDNAPCCDQAAELRRVILANALLIENDFPERDDWIAEFHKEARLFESLWDVASNVQEAVGFEEEAFHDEDQYDDNGHDDYEHDDYEDEEDGSLHGPGISNPLSSDYEGVSTLAGRTMPITNSTQRTGRNEPCPCGSGEKFKKCCLRKQ